MRRVINHNNNTQFFFSPIRYRYLFQKCRFRFRYYKSETEMSFISLFSIIILLVTESNFAKDLPTPQPTYITKYDYLDIDQILENERILRRLMDCIMDRGPCTRAGKELKRFIPEALQTGCRKCNERQKMNTGRALAYLLHYKPEYWSELVNRFDQSGNFRRKLKLDSGDVDETLQSTSVRADEMKKVN